MTYKIPDIRMAGLWVLFAAFLTIHWLILPPLELYRKIPAWMAAMSMSSMALTFILAARWPWLEPLTGGLDKSYRLHRFLGIFALVAMVGHWILVPGGAGLSLFPLLAEFGEDAGEVAVFILLAAILLSAIRFLPYRAWKYTHYLMGPAFFIAVLHTFFSDIPLILGSMAWLAMLFVSIVGIFAWVSKLRSDLSRKPSYQVKKIERLNGATAITLAPLQDAIEHSSGQFAFFSFEQARLNEYHPFTIASPPQPSGNLKIIVKSLGYYTEKLSNDLKEGTQVTIDGPYGRFLPERGRKHQVWIAGGIGITPFLASMLNSSVMKGREIDLLICARSIDDILYRAQIEDAKNKWPNFRVHELISDKEQRLSADFIRDHITNASNASYWFCGSAALRSGLEEAFETLSIPRRRLHFEYFNMRGEVDVSLRLFSKIKKIAVYFWRILKNMYYRIRHRQNDFR